MRAPRARYGVLAAIGLLLSISATAVIPPIPLPGDVAVTLSADPMVNLAPGQPIAFTMTVTNHGPAPIPVFSIRGPDMYDQFYEPVSVTWSDCHLRIIVVDLNIPPYSYWVFAWHVSGPDIGGPPLDVNETRTCHFTLALTPNAPPITALTVGLSSTAYVDPDPSNDRATVLLGLTPEPIPALSSTLQWLLAGLLSVAAGFARRRFRVF
jgi:hypothetical protein